MPAPPRASAWPAWAPPPVAAPPIARAASASSAGPGGCARTRPGGSLPKVASISARASSSGRSSWPTRYSVALAGKYQSPQNSSSASRPQRATCSILPIGKRQPSAFSSCRNCSSWQSTRYSIEFIICASAITARRSFSMRPGKNCGANAISASASSTCARRAAARAAAWAAAWAAARRGAPRGPP